jgi:hypothetical protein
MTRLMSAVLVAAALSSAALAQVQALPATVNITPDTLNLKAKGQWVNCTIRLPEGSKASDINVSTVLLAGTVPAAKGSKSKGAVLTVKFSRAQLVNYINTLAATTPGFTFPADVTLTVTGTLKDGVTSFSGQDTIHAIKPGGKKK